MTEFNYIFYVKSLVECDCSKCSWIVKATRIPQGSHKVSYQPVDLTIFHAQEIQAVPLQWRHNERDGISNHDPHDCLLNRFFRRRSKTTSKLRVTGLCVWNSPVTGEFPGQRASNAENFSIGWRHHEIWQARAPPLEFLPDRHTYPAQKQNAKHHGCLYICACFCICARVTDM